METIYTVLFYTTRS